MAVFTAFAATTIGTFLTTTVVGNLLLSTGLSLLSQALIGKPKRNEQKFSINTQLRAGGEVPRSFGFGNYVTAGSLNYANTWGTDGSTQNAYLTQVITLADIPNVSLTGFIVDSNYVTIGQTQEGIFGFPITEYNKSDKNHLWIKFFNGTQTTVDQLLTENVSSSERPYGSDRVGNGVAYAVITARINQDLFPSIPQFRFQLRGRAYDPRKDSSVGGTGTHRIDDISTWGNGPEADNPVVQIYNILRGIRYNNEWLYGLQRVAPSQLPLSEWFAQMDKAEVSVVESSGSVAQYRSGGEIPVETPIADIIDSMLTTCSGRLSEVGGAYKIKIGAPDAPVVSFTDGDVVSTSGQVFSPFFGLADLVNGIEANYPDPEQIWNLQAAPPLFNAQAEAEDGNRRLMGQVDMFFSPYPEQVQRLMKQALLDARNSRQHALTLSPAYWPLEAGDVVQWTSERNGYVNKLFRVDAVSDLPSADVVVNLTEVDPSDYDWNTGTEFVPVAEGNLSFTSRPDLPIDPQEWSVQSSDLRDPNNTARRPAIVLNWPTTYDDIDSVEFQVRLASNATLVTTGLFGDFERGSGLITDGLLPETNYEVRARLITIDGQRSPFTPWLAVQSGAGYFSNEDFEGGVRQLFEDAGLSAPEIVNALPTTGNFQGRIVFLTTENKLYVWDGTSWGLVAEEIGVIDFSDIEGQIQSAQIANGAVLNQAIADLAINEAKLATNAVTTAKIANTAISSAKIADLAVLEGKLANNSVTTSKVSNNAITGVKITDNAITAPKINANAVTADKINANAVTSEKIAAGSVIADKIAANAITASKVAIGDFTNLVLNEELDDFDGWVVDSQVVGPTNSPSDMVSRRVAVIGDTITFNRHIRWNASVQAGKSYFMSAEVRGSGTSPRLFSFRFLVQWRDRNNTIIRSNVVTRPQTTTAAVFETWSVIAPAGAVSATFLFGRQNTVNESGTGFIGSPVVRVMGDGDLIVDGAITADKIATNAVVADKINAGAVIADKIATNAVTAIKINANAVTADKINASAVTTAKLAALAVTADKIAANAITANKIAANTITGDKISANTITGGLLATTGIITNSAQIDNAVVTNAKIANGAITTAKIEDAAITNAKIGDTIQSDNFTSGQSGNGWRIQKSGAAEFGTLALRVGSVSVLRDVRGISETITSFSFVTIASITFNPFSNNSSLIINCSGVVTQSGTDPSYEIEVQWRGQTILGSLMGGNDAGTTLDTGKFYNFSVILPITTTASSTLSLRLRRPTGINAGFTGDLSCVEVQR